MAFYYVKSGGTATGDAGRATSARTGSFASMGVSAYYDNISGAITVPTTPSVGGDSVYVSDTHTHTYGANPTITGEDTAGLLKIISVSDTNADAYSAGAVETRTASGDFILAEGLYFHGVSLVVGDDLNLLSDARVTFEDFTITFEDSGSKLNPNGDGCLLVMKNGTVTTTYASAWSSVMLLTNGCYVHWTDVLLTSPNGITSFMLQGFSSGGGTAIFDGCDVSILTGQLLVSVGSNPQADDLINVQFHGSKMNAGITAANEDFVKESQRLSMFNSSSSSAEAEYQFYQKALGGDLEDESDAGIHRDESTAFPSGTKVSIKVTTNADASMETPFVFDLPTRYAALSSATTDTIRIYFTTITANTLTDTNIWAELIYPDNTNNETYNYLNNRNTDIIAATPTNRTDDSAGSTWKNGGIDLTGYNEYRMDLDTSGNVGADSVPIIRIHVAEPSIITYFDTTVGVVS